MAFFWMNRYLLTFVWLNIRLHLFGWIFAYICLVECLVTFVWLNIWFAFHSNPICLDEWKWECRLVGRSRFVSRLAYQTIHRLRHRGHHHGYHYRCLSDSSSWKSSLSNYNLTVRLSISICISLASAPSLSIKCLWKIWIEISAWKILNIEWISPACNLLVYMRDRSVSIHHPTIALYFLFSRHLHIDCMIWYVWFQEKFTSVVSVILSWRRWFRLKQETGAHTGQINGAGGFWGGGKGKIMRYNLGRGFFWG